MTTTTADIFGYLGGILLAGCTIPQLVTMWQNLSARDVSLSWSISYFLGLTFTLTYMVLIDARVAIYCISVEALLGILIIGSKIYLDIKYPGDRKGEEELVLDNAKFPREGATVVAM